MKKEHRKYVERRRKERQNVSHGSGVDVEIVDNGGEEHTNYTVDDEGGEWTIHVDEESGASYKYNSLSGESVWIGEQQKDIETK